MHLFHTKSSSNLIYILYIYIHGGSRGGARGALAPAEI